VAINGEKEIVIAIRGTVSVKDWMSNLMTPRIVDEFHFCFQLYTEAIWKQLQNILPDSLKDKTKIITRPVGKRKQAIAATSYLFLCFHQARIDIRYHHVKGLKKR